VEFIGEIPDAQKMDFLGNALALLFPIDWPEPFGLVMIEALSAGTPVIAWRNGSVPEVITDGISGMIVESVDEAVSAIGRIGLLNREAVRHEFESHFTAIRWRISTRALTSAFWRTKLTSLPPLSSGPYNSQRKAAIYVKSRREKSTDAGRLGVHRLAPRKYGAGFRQQPSWPS
jgi:hypothetical protein